MYYYFYEVPLECSSPPVITNGMFQNASRSVGTKIQLECVPPYVDVNPTYVCNDNAVWNGTGYCSELKLLV